MTLPQADLQLYGTLGCHLCDLAERVLVPLLEQGCAIEAVDIADDDDLMARYQTAIPVLANARGQELHWPFTTEQAQTLWSDARDN